MPELHLCAIFKSTLVWVLKRAKAVEMPMTRKKGGASKTTIKRFHSWKLMKAVVVNGVTLT